jgi:hypothetical protein
MSQLLTLIWLKWKLVRNSLRSRKAVANQVASILGVMVTLAFAVSLSVGLGFAAYFLSQPGALSDAFRRSASRSGMEEASVEFIFFSIFAFLYLMWATVPLSIGSTKQFDVARMLIYPISLKKLFAIDFVSEFTSLASMFAVPAILAMSIGAGLGAGNLSQTLLAFVPAVAFGIALSKWLSTIIGSLVRRKRARGETIVAMVGAIAGLGGALAGQLGPILFRHAQAFKSLRWTPPGAAAVLLVKHDGVLDYVLAFFTLSLYAVLLIAATYWIARRSALGLGGARRRKVVEAIESETYAGWQLPFVSSHLAAVIEKELRYAMRNAQLRMMALMPFVLIIIRLVNSNRMRSGMRSGGDQVAHDFFTYGSVLLATGGVLYVFLLLAGLSCNLFAFEEGGMRTFILSPIDRRKILLGKNIAVTIIAALFSSALLLVNGLVFRDLSPPTLLFAAISFVIFSSLMAIIGNWFSLTFPKRMEFGKRLNVSGVAGLLLIPMVLTMGLPPFAATVAGYLAESVLVQFLVLGAFAVLSLGLYLLILDFQGRSLERREISILESVKEPSD